MVLELSNFCKSKYNDLGESAFGGVIGVIVHTFVVSKEELCSLKQ